MQWFKLRPTFDILLGESRDLAIERLSEEFKRQGVPDRIRMHGEYGEIHLPREEHRLWSPHLSFFIAEEEGRGSRLHGRFAPRWGVWTAVWAFYLAMSFSAFYGFTLAYSQWMINEYPWGNWVAFAALLAIASLYVIAHVGQQLSTDQMTALRVQLESIVSSVELHEEPAAISNDQGGNGSGRNEQGPNERAAMTI